MSNEDAHCVEAVRDFFAELRKKGLHSFTNEEATKMGVILPALQKLGWDVFNTTEVEPEHGAGNRRVDYALMLKRTPAAFIEAKRSGEELTEKHQKQLLDYAFEEGIKLAVLTNGSTWEFYLPLMAGNWHQRKVLAVDVEHQHPDEAAERMVRLLSKNAISSGEAEKHARELHRSKQRQEKIGEALPEAWKRLIERPEELLVDLIAEETESICGFKPDGQQVKGFLRQVAQPAPPPRMTTEQVARTRRRKHPSRVQPMPSQLVGTKPSQVSLLGREYPVTAWFEALETVVQELVKRHPRDYEEHLLAMVGSKRPYISRRGGDLRKPRRIARTGLCLESNLSAQAVHRLIMNLLEEFGYKPKDFRVTYR